MIVKNFSVVVSASQTEYFDDLQQAINFQSTLKESSDLWNELPELKLIINTLPARMNKERGLLKQTFPNKFGLEEGKVFIPL